MRLPRALGTLRLRFPRSVATVLATIAALASCGCAHMGRLSYVPQTVAPIETDSTRVRRALLEPPPIEVGPMFGDTLIGLVPGSGDSTRRYLGRLRDGFTADTLNIFLLGDNRPGNRTTRLTPQYLALREMFSPNPLKIIRGLWAIPVGLVKGLYPDLALIRDLPGQVTHMPTWGPEQKVVTAMLARADTLRNHGKLVAAVLNTGDLVNDGRYPAHWERFLRINRPLTSRVPYFAVAGNHERTDAVDGVANWRTATGLPVGSDRLYYCFDSADGWVRFIGLDSNPMTDPAHLWTREVQIKFSDEEISWMVARLKEHHGPAVVFMHHPPFSVGFHHDEWQADSVLLKRREQMMTALHEAGIGVLAGGHEHAYERALFTWPDAVLIDIVTGGGGAPLHTIPTAYESAKLFASYHVAGAKVEPQNVVTGSFNHFIHVRLWFGGGDITTWAVDKKSATTLADKVRIDLSRFGIPKVDEHKIPILPKGTSTSGPHEENAKKPNPAKVDSVANSKRILTTPTPRNTGKPAVSRSTMVRDSLASARRDSIDSAKRDTLAAHKRIPTTAPPIKPVPR